MACGWLLRYVHFHFVNSLFLILHLGSGMSYKQHIQEIKLYESCNLDAALLTTTMRKEMLDYYEIENEFIISWLLNGGRPAPTINISVWCTLAEYGYIIERHQKVQNSLSSRKKIILVKEAKDFADELIPYSLNAWICAQAKERNPWTRNLEYYGMTGTEESIYLQLKARVQKQNQHQNSTIDGAVFIPETVKDDKTLSAEIPQEGQEHEKSIEEIKEQARCLLKENKELSSKCFHLRNELKQKEQKSFHDMEEKVKLLKRSEQLRSILDADDGFSVIRDLVKERNQVWGKKDDFTDY